jgi:hypothetical protein
MKKKLLAFLIGIILCSSAFSQVEDVAYTYKITGNNNCSIEFGKIQLSKKINNKFRFRININNKSGYEGEVGGYATYISSTKAIYKSKECGSITFIFKPGEILQIIEKNCSNNHGANICFDGNYIKY